jgi:hypothetical protein
MRIKVSALLAIPLHRGVDVRRVDDGLFRNGFSGSSTIALKARISRSWTGFF